MINVKTYKFNTKVVEKLENTKFGNKWPIVYIINMIMRNIQGKQ